MAETQRIAVLIPCHNEQATIAKVVDDFRRELPAARICVFDNDSTDDSAAIAREHGAEVFHEPRLGKGYVIEAMFETIDADFYVMVDGDDTYDPSSVHVLLDEVATGRAAMCVGARVASEAEAFRPLHVGGNFLVRKLVNRLGGANLSDILSGYRVFNRRVAKCLPILSSGFEVETEMTVQMLFLKMHITEIPTPYRPRPEGSESKLRTCRDGGRVLWKIFSLFRQLKPLTFFGLVAIFFFLLGLLAGIAPIHDYLTLPNHEVKRFPLAILATGLMLLSAGSLFLGVLLHSLNWRFIELHNVLARRK